eukprot:scaffold78307_cov23-Tisochrysis_lutea.AAC.3
MAYLSPSNEAVPPCSPAASTLLTLSASEGRGFPSTGESDCASRFRARRSASASARPEGAGASLWRRGAARMATRGAPPLAAAAALALANAAFCMRRSASRVSSSSSARSAAASRAARVSATQAAKRVSLTPISRCMATDSARLCLSVHDKSAKLCSSWTRACRSVSASA